MPVKSWNDTEKLTLLRTALACYPNFKIDANMVAEMWPGDDENAKPNARSVRDTFRSIMKHGKDLEILRQIRQGAAAKDEDADEDDKLDAGPAGLASSTPKTPASKNPVTTPRRGMSTIRWRSTADQSSTGYKRKRRAVPPCSDGDMTSATETTSGDEADLASPTPLARKTLPVRKARCAATAASEEEDAGAEDLDTEGSDGEYDLAKERKEKAERKAKLARRARK